MHQCVHCQADAPDEQWVRLEGTPLIRFDCQACGGESVAHCVFEPEVYGDPGPARRAELRVRWQGKRPRGWEVAAIRTLFEDWREKSPRAFMAAAVDGEFVLGTYAESQALSLQREARARDLELIVEIIEEDE